MVTSLRVTPSFLCFYLLFVILIFVPDLEIDQRKPGERLLGKTEEPRQLNEEVTVGRSK